MMIKKLYACLIVSVLLFAGCTNDLLSPSVDNSAKTIEPATPEPEVSVSYAPLNYANVEELLLGVGMAKFGEPSAARNNTIDYNPSILKNMAVVYEPNNVKAGFNLDTVSVYYYTNISFQHKNNTGSWANLIWEGERNYPLDDFFGRGAVQEYLEEHNGITYAITEWVTANTNILSGYIVSWKQYGQDFTADLPADFTLPDIFAFCNAVPITTWELSGDAVSVSIQGMEEVGVIDGEGMEIIAEDDVLYRVDGGGMERIGYRWLTDEGAERYQYVLEPGEYQFSAVGGGSGAELLVKHFEAGEVVSELDYTETVAGKAGSRFILTVSGDPGETAIDLIDE